MPRSGHRSAFQIYKYPVFDTPRWSANWQPSRQCASDPHCCPFRSPLTGRSASGGRLAETVHLLQKTIHNWHFSLKFAFLLRILARCCGRVARFWFHLHTGASLAYCWQWSGDQWAADDSCPVCRCFSFAFWPWCYSLWPPPHFSGRSLPLKTHLNLIESVAWLALCKCWFWNCRRSRLRFPIPYAITSFCCHGWLLV